MLGGLAAETPNTVFWAGRPTPRALTDSVISPSQLPAGWQVSAHTYTIHLPIKHPTLDGQPDILARCTNPEVRLFGPVELEVVFLSPITSPDASFEEQIGRTSIRNLAEAADAEATVNGLESACFSSATARGEAIATSSSPSQPVGPWDQLLGISGVNSGITDHVPARDGH